MSYNINTQEIDRNDKRRVIISLQALSTFLVFSIFFMPDYFGISVLNVQRTTLLLIWYIIFRDKEKTKDFLNTIMSFEMNGMIILYMIVLLYTALYRVDLGTFMNPVIDQLAVFYTMMYLFKEYISIEKFLKIIIVIAYVLCIMGIFEFLMGKTVFHLLETIPGMISVTTRNGQYRIMGPAHHALGYGLYLLIMLPIACYKYKDRTLNLFNRVGLLVLLVINAYCTGSRSTLGLILIEIAVIFLFCTLRQKQVIVLIGSYCSIIIAIIIVMFYETSVVQGILISVASMLDGVFNTNLARSMGVDTTIYDWSTRYRELLPLIFQLDWINPIMGRGYGYTFNWSYEGFWISSIDNYYINQYVKVAYPGLIVQIIFYIYFVGKTVVSAFFKGSALARAVLISFGFYFINLYWVDALGTLDYIFVLFAAIYASDKKYEQVKESEKNKNIVEE